MLTSESNMGARFPKLYGFWTFEVGASIVAKAAGPRKRMKQIKTEMAEIKEKLAALKTERTELKAKIDAAASKPEKSAV